MRVRRVNVEVVLIDPAEAGGVGTELWHDTSGELRGEEIQPLQHARAGEVIVHALFEDDRQHREAEHRVRAHGLHARQSLQPDGERISDLVLNLLRRAPRPVREHDNLVFGQVGNCVYRRAVKRARAKRDEEEHAAHHQEAVPQRPGDEVVNHAESLLGMCGAGGHHFFGASFARNFAGSFLKSGRQLLQQNLISWPSWT